MLTWIVLKLFKKRKKKQEIKVLTNLTQLVHENMESIGKQAVESNLLSFPRVILDNFCLMTM